MDKAQLYELVKGGAQTILKALHQGFKGENVRKQK